MFYFNLLYVAAYNSENIVKNKKLEGDVVSVNKSRI